jgi:hypothetical protein
MMIYLAIEAISPNVQALNIPAEQPYKICTVITSVKSSSGALIKTLCYVSQTQTYASAQATCSNNQMKLAAIEDATVQTAVLSAVGSQYDWAKPGIFWVNATAPIGSCSLVSNNGQLATNIYTVSSEPCNNSRKFFCQY